MFFWQKLIVETTNIFKEQAVRVATQYDPAPASLTIISCKYENRQRLQFTTEFAKTQTTTTRKNKHCAILPSLCRHCQSKAQQNMGAGYAFFAYQTS